jgi:hypothetical protein
MADDPRTEGRDPQVATWLEVEPLDDLTRRRLVSTALGESGVPTKRPSRAWRWMAAAAAVVLVGGITLAVVTAGGGHDEQRASTPVRTPSAADSLTPQSEAVNGAPGVGDFGDLNQPANVARLRGALAADTSFSTKDSSSATPAPAAAAGAASRLTCFFAVPENATMVATGTGTLDGRRATVALFEKPDGARSYEVLLEDPCEQRKLP